MTPNKFQKAEKRPEMNPVDFFNFYKVDELFSKLIDKFKLNQVDENTLSNGYDLTISHTNGRIKLSNDLFVEEHTSARRSNEAESKDSMGDKDKAEDDDDKLVSNFWIGVAEKIG
jgi:hypothetical protein